ncbi:MAG: TRAP transporter substrate-binding protein DctP [Rhodospirillaceae bacterium]
MTKATLRLAAACLGGLAWAAAPAAAETVKFTIIAASPVTVTPTKVTKEFFVPEVNKRLAASGKDFRIEWNEAYGPNLAKFTEVLESVEEGIAHMGVLLRNFEEAKLPLEQYASMIPFGITDMDKMREVDSKVRARVPQMLQQFDKYNQLYLAGAMTDNTHMFTKFPIHTVDDVKGRKIGSSGVLAHVLRGTGAVAVTANMAQAYVDIKNGVYDGYTMGEALAMPYRTFEVAPHLTRTNFGITVVPCLIVNKDAWAKLPEHARQVIKAVADEWVAVHTQVDKERLVEFTRQMVEKGLKVAEMPLDERRKWAAAMPNVAKEWAANMDKAGLPGSAILTAYMDEVRASGIPVVRQWDRE